MKAISSVSDRRPNTLIQITICIAVMVMFGAAMSAHAAHSFMHRAPLGGAAMSGPSGVPDCDKVFKSGNCCMALHCAVGVATGAARPAFRPFSSGAVAEAPNEFPSQAKGRLERPPKQSS
jgi:hypothetical protein